AHDLGVVVRDRSPTAAEYLDVVRALFAQKIHNLREKFDVAAVVTRNADRAHVFLDRRPNDIRDWPVITEINDFDPVPDELEIDRVDRTVVSVTNRDGG